MPHAEVSVLNSCAAPVWTCWLELTSISDYFNPLSNIEQTPQHLICIIERVCKNETLNGCPAGGFPSVKIGRSVRIPFEDMIKGQSSIKRKDGCFPSLLFAGSL